MKQYARRVKAVLAGFVVTLSLVIPFTLLVTGATIPTMYLEGMRMQVREDGFVQLFLDISVEEVKTWAGMTYQLEYHSGLMTPSDFDTNAALTTGNRDDFFRLDPELYDPTAGDPINKTDGAYISKVEHNTWPKPGALTMQMYLKQNETLTLAGSKLSVHELDTEDDDAERYVVDTSSTGHGKTVIGTLSFRVKAEDVPMIAALYSTGGPVRDPKGKDSSYLLSFEGQSSGAIEDKAWSLYFYGANTMPQGLFDKTNATSQALFDLGFAEEIISVEPVERQVALNAYQAYSAGDETDIPLALQKFGPMVTVTYASGRRENVIMPWGDTATTEAEYEAVLYDGGGAIGTYDPTGAVNTDPAKPDYQITQYYTWEEPDGAGGTETKRFPIPVTVDLTVQEITLLGFTSEDLERTYPLVNSTTLLPTLSSGAFGLALPESARVVTDIVPGNTSLLMPVPGWRATNNNLALRWYNASQMNQLYADGNSDGTVHWPVTSDFNTLVPANHVGTYTFEMAANNGGMAADFTKAAVQARFPWLTVPDDGDPAYKMPQARRYLAEQANVNDTALYSVEYVSTSESVNGTPILTLKAARAGSNDIAANSSFRIRMPDGSEIGTGLTFIGNDGASVPLVDWFEAVDMADYTETYAAPIAGTSNASYTLAIDSGTLIYGSYTEQRDVLRRFTNLGGYFYVSILDGDTAGTMWTDFIPVYVPPRQNKHTAEGEYNFIGVNSGLFSYPGLLGKTVTVPQGSYHPVNEEGLPIYALQDGTTTTDKDDLLVTGLHSEEFGVATTYDGLTGAEPGRLYTFTVEGTVGDWPQSLSVNYPTSAPPYSTPENPTGSYDQYGPDEFVDGQYYGAYGRVDNPSLYEATVRLEEARVAPGTGYAEELRVTYEGGSSTVQLDGDGDLILARYDNRTTGYTDRQEYEFVIENLGDTDIYDLGLLNLTPSAPDGGHFVVTRPPAAFLPAGGRTTFTLTYVYGLAPNSSMAAPFNSSYLNHFYVTSSTLLAEDVVAADPNTYLATFDASFLVTAESQHRIIFDIVPADGSMGEAHTIVGEEKDDPTAPTWWEMNYDPGSNRAEAGKVVYFVVTKQDPLYEITSVTVTDAAGTTISRTEYNTSGDGTNGYAELEDGTTVYFFTMPDYDVTVKVEFTEPLVSKLRLHDGWIWASPDSVPVTNTTDTNMEKYLLYQKEFTDTESPPPPGTTPAGTTLMQLGRAGDVGIDPVCYQYLTVIPYEAEYIQVEVLLRRVLALVGNSPVNSVGVLMYLYNPDGTLNTTAFPTTGVFYSGSGETNPAGPPIYSTHLSRDVAGPDPDESIYVEIELSATIGGVTSYGRYFIEIHRAPAKPVVVYNFGNSPHGLIRNAKVTDIDTADKDDALEAFIANRYSFDGLDADYTPNVLTGKADLLATHYWSEAWATRDTLYEPETGTGMTSLGPPPTYNTAVYDPDKNLDLNEYALFVQAGAAFDEPGLLKLYDSSGRAVDLDPDEGLVSCSAEVTLLSATGSIVARFSMPDPATTTPTEIAEIARRTALLDMGLQGKTGTTGWWNTGAQVQKLDGLGDPEFDADGNKVYEALSGSFTLRPGVYELVYTYTDFDGVSELTVTRPLVVLLPPGDVNGSHATDATDRNDLRKRVTVPLAYDPAVQFFDHTNLYKFRVCDLNNDRNINNIDANQFNSTPRTAYYLFTGYRES